MSGTYEAMNEASARQYLTDLHGIVSEFSRRSVAAPYPSNIVFIVVDFVVLAWQWSAPVDLRVQRTPPTRRQRARSLVGTFSQCRQN
jgi:hypothetical protein